MQNASLPDGVQGPLLDTALAGEIVRDGIARYIVTRRERIDPFVASHFSLTGTLRLHRAALGWDIARAPLNLAMAAPQAGIWFCRKSSPETAAVYDRRQRVRQGGG
jgi:uncharacterized protein DUF6635